MPMTTFALVLGGAACTNVPVPAPAHIPAPAFAPALAPRTTSSLLPYAGPKWRLTDAPYAGMAAYAFGLHYEGDTPLTLDTLPGTVSGDVRAVLATGSVRNPSCTPAFEGRTTPYEELFVNGRAEVLNPVPSGARPGYPDLLIVMDPAHRGGAAWTIGSSTARTQYTEAYPLATEAARAAGPVDANLVVRFLVKYWGPASPDMLLAFDGEVQPVRRSDGVFRVRTTPGAHTLEAHERGYGRRVDVEVPPDGCVSVSETLAFDRALFAEWSDDTIELWFGDATPFPIQRVTSVTYDTGEAERDLTRFFEVSEERTRLVARDPDAITHTLVEVASGLEPHGEVRIRVKAVGPGGAALSGEIAIDGSGHGTLPRTEVGTP